MPEISSAPIQQVFRRLGGFARYLDDKVPTPVTVPEGPLPAHMIRRADVPDFLGDSAIRSTVVHNTTHERLRSLLETGPRVEFDGGSLYGQGVYAWAGDWPVRDTAVELAIKLKNPMVGTADEVRGERGRILRSTGLPSHQLVGEVPREVMLAEGRDGVIMLNDKRTLSFVAGYLNENIKIVVDDLPTPGAVA